MGLDSTIWGPSLWLIFHSIALQYPDHPTLDDQKRYKSFYEQWTFFIPCEKCRIHYQQLLQSNPLQEGSLALQNPSSLFEWTVHIHNEVNVSLHKKPWSLQKVYRLYSMLYQPHPASFTSSWTRFYVSHPYFYYALIGLLIGLFGILLLLILFYLLFFKKKTLS